MPQPHFVPQIQSLAAHAALFDEPSAAIFLRELIAIYESLVVGHASPFPELPRATLDYARWQRQWLRGLRLEEHLPFWREQLAGQLPVLELATDHPRGAAIVRAFVDGVNAYVAETERNPKLLPLEFSLLELKPGRFTPEVVISRHQGLLGNVTQELDYGIAVHLIGAEKVKELSWFRPGDPVLALDPATGATRWTWTGPGPGYASPALVDIAGTPQIVTMTNQSIVAVEAKSGAALWTIPFPDEWHENIVTPLWTGSELIVSLDGEIVDTIEKIEAFLPEIDGMMGSGLITLSPVRVLHYGSSKTHAT